MVMPVDRTLPFFFPSPPLAAPALPLAPSLAPSLAPPALAFKAAAFFSAAAFLSLSAYC